MRLLQHGQVPQPGRPAVLVPLPQPQVLGEPDQHGSDQERLVLVVADVLDLEHHVTVQQLPEVQLVAAFEEPAGRAQPQAAQPDSDESPHVPLHLRPVGGLAHHHVRGRLQIPSAGYAGQTPGVAGSPSTRSQPCSPYTRVSAAFSTWGNGSSASNAAKNRLLTRSAWVCSGNRVPSDHAAGASGLIPAAACSASPGRIRITSVPGSLAAIPPLYSALAGSITSHGIPATVACSNRDRTVWDFPAPVAPDTNAWRFKDERGNAGNPAGIRFRSSSSPTLIPPAATSGIVSNSGRSTNRALPGISLAGGRTSAASTADEPKNGDAGTG